MLRSVSLATLLTLTLVASPLLAQQAQPAAPGAHTADSLFEALNKLGYKAERDPSSGGGVIVLKAAQKELSVRVSLSDDRRYLCLRATLGNVDPAVTSAEAVRKLVAENHMIGPAFYSYDATTKLLFLQTRHVNREVTPAKLRIALQGFVDLLRKQEPTWRSENFVRPATATASVGG
jgi:hypothetical protein